MKKLLFILIFFVSTFLYSCKSTNKSERNDSLISEISELNIQLNEKDKLVENYIKTINEIYENLDSIKIKQNIVASYSANAKGKETEIAQNILAINSFIEKNNQKIKYLEQSLSLKNSGLKEANKTMDGIKKLSDRLNTEIELRDMELGDLKNYLGKLNLKIEELNFNLNETITENNSNKTEINSGYYRIGSISSLKSEGVITKEGGFIGIGKTYRINKDFKKSVFSKINIYSSTTISINAKTYKIITSHASNSYKVIGTKKYIESIEIINPKEFWSASKYLVIAIEN